MTKLPNEYGLSPGFAYDIEVNDESGMPWDFDKAEQRERCMTYILNQKPDLLIGNPKCTAFSALQGLNKWRMKPEKRNARMEKGLEAHESRSQTLPTSSRK